MKGAVYMYNAQDIAERIKSTAKRRKVLIKDILASCELSKNTISSMLSGGSTPKSENLAKIADELDCSVDYLLGRKTNNAQENQTLLLDIDITKVFCQDDTVRKFASRIYEALTSLYNSNALLNNIAWLQEFFCESFQDGYILGQFDTNNAFFLALECIILKLYDTYDFISESKTDSKINVFIKSSNMGEKLDKICDVFDDCKNNDKSDKNKRLQFIRNARHAVAHIEHTSIDYANIIKKVGTGTLKIENGCYANKYNYMISVILIPLYKNIVNDELSDEDAIDEIARLYADLNSELLGFLNGVFEFFLINYTNINSVLDNNLEETIEAQVIENSDSPQKFGSYEIAAFGGKEISSFDDDEPGTTLH
jgi:transcriptional regulator with XRE-family HTH domain